MAAPSPWRKKEGREKSFYMDPHPPNKHGARTWGWQFWGISKWGWWSLTWGVHLLWLAVCYYAILSPSKNAQCLCPPSSTIILIIQSKSFCSSRWEWSQTFPELCYKVSLLKGSSNTDAMGEIQQEWLHNPSTTSAKQYREPKRIICNKLFEQIIQLHFRSKSDHFLGA